MLVLGHEQIDGCVLQLTVTYSNGDGYGGECNDGLNGPITFTANINLIFLTKFSCDVASWSWFNIRLNLRPSISQLGRIRRLFSSAEAETPNFHHLYNHLAPNFPSASTVALQSAEYIESIYCRSFSVTS